MKVNNSQRLTALERAAGGAASECACIGGGPGTSWRVVYQDAELGRGLTDPVATCAKCGKERPVIRVVHTDDWRSASGVNLRDWTKGGADNDS